MQLAQHCSSAQATDHNTLTGNKPTLPAPPRPCENSPPNMAAENTNTPKPNKSAFIRSQPAEVSAAEVVAKAKADGLTITPGLVYGVRSQLKATRKAKKGAAKKTSAAKKGAATKPVRSKGDFVRKFPKLSPQELVTKAKTEGVQLEVGYVYSARGNDRNARNKKREARAASPRRGGAVPRPLATTSSAEDLLKAIAAEIGLARAMEILAAERARVRAVIGG